MHKARFLLAGALPDRRQHRFGYPDDDLALTLALYVKQ